MEKDSKQLKEEYRALRSAYFYDKWEIKDKAKSDINDRKYKYKRDKIAVKSPLKAARYEERIERRKRNRILNDAPKRRTIEEIGNATTHGVGAIVAMVCTSLMILKSYENTLHLTAAIIYGTCFIFQMLFSCLYHSFRGGTTVKRIFRRFDYSTIYLQIGGTFAPLYLIYMMEHMWGPVYAYSLFGTQWALIVLGITFVAIFGPGRVRWVHYTLYFVLGWSGIMFLPSWWTNCIPLLVYILTGGVIYTLGMIPFGIFKNKPIAHFIWHFVVLAGSLLMWTGIYLYVF